MCFVTRSAKPKKKTTMNNQHKTLITTTKPNNSVESTRVRQVRVKRYVLYMRKFLEWKAENSITFSLRGTCVSNWRSRKKRLRVLCGSIYVRLQMCMCLFLCIQKCCLNQVAEYGKYSPFRPHTLAANYFIERNCLESQSRTHSHTFCDSRIPSSLFGAHAGRRGFI